MSTHDALLLALPLTPTVGAAADRPAEPVGLGPRAAAFALDYLPIAGYLVLLTAVGAGLGWAFPEAVARAFGQAARAQAIGFALVTLPVGLYFALSEASGRQATWGKRRLGLVVVGPAGGGRTTWWWGRGWCGAGSGPTRPATGAGPCRVRRAGRVPVSSRHGAHRAEVRWARRRSSGQRWRELRTDGVAAGAPRSCGRSTRRRNVRR